MSLRKLVLCLLIPLLLSACSGVPQTRQMASAAQMQQAKNIISSPDYAVIYVRRPYGSLDYSYLNVYANDDQLGQLISQQFITINASPGHYQFLIEEKSPSYPDNKHLNGSVAQFELELEAGAVVLLSCGENAFGSWNDGDGHLLPAQECSENSGRGVVTKNGITSCSKMFKSKGDIGWSGVNYTKESLKNCRLTYDKKRYFDSQFSSSFSMVKADVEMIKGSAAVTKKSAAIAAKTAVNLSAVAAENKISAKFIKIQSDEKCKLKNDNWAYTGKACENGLAHGMGRAEDNAGLKFIGMFENGQRTKGEIFQAGNMIFEGNLVDDKPNGNAICYYEGEHEECRFYKGKRIDTLYKIRKENAKMKEDMARMQSARSVSASNTSPKGVGDYAVDAVQQEGIDRATSFIFDSLF